MVSATIKSRLFAAVLAIGAVVLCWLAVGDLGDLTRAIGRGDPLIAWWPRAIQPLPIAVALLAVAVMLVPRFDPAAIGRSRAKGARPGLATVCFGIAIACVPIVFLVPPIGTALIGARLEARGYRTCPPATWERPIKTRWALPINGRPLARCPTDQHGRPAKAPA